MVTTDFMIMMVGGVTSGRAGRSRARGERDPHDVREQDVQEQGQRAGVRGAVGEDDVRQTVDELELRPRGGFGDGTP